MRPQKTHEMDPHSITMQGQRAEIAPITSMIIDRAHGLHDVLSTSSKRYTLKEFSRIADTSKTCNRPAIAAADDSIRISCSLKRVKYKKRSNDQYPITIIQR